MTDIPYGRVFRIDPAGKWTLITEYDGQPNGLKIHKDGRIFITDDKRGIVLLDPVDGKVTPLIETRGSERFEGVNDLFFAVNGDLYFTGQVQTGLHDPTGRVYRYDTASKVGLFIQMSGGHAGPDGMALGSDGGPVVAHPSTTVWRFDALGRPTHHVDCGDDIHCTNIAFAGNDLFVVVSRKSPKVAAGTILKATMPVGGQPMFSPA